MAGHDVLVTFNGKSFDWPMVLDRSVRHRLAGKRPAAELLHVDLLHHARRRWRRQLPDCRLQTLEQLVCRRRRSDDIPGQRIPAAYAEFVRTGFEREMDAILLPQRARFGDSLRSDAAFGGIGSVRLGGIAVQAGGRYCAKWLEKPAIFSQSSKNPGFFAFCCYLVAGKAVSGRASGVKMASWAPKAVCDFCGVSYDFRSGPAFFSANSPSLNRPRHPLNPVVASPR